MQGGSALCADNLFTGSKRNVRELMEDKRFEFLCHDVVNRLDMEVNQIYNLPCPASPCTIAFCGPAPASVCGPEAHPQPESYWRHANPEVSVPAATKANGQRRGTGSDGGFLWRHSAKICLEAEHSCL